MENLSLEDAYDYPIDYKDRLESACEKTLAFIKESSEKAHNPQACNQEDDSDGADSDGSFFAEEQIQPVSTTTSTIPPDQENLVKALAQCPAMNLGFHRHPVFPGGDEEWCCCPFGRKMKEWRKQWKIQVSEECTGNASKKRVGPSALLQHMKAKASDKNHLIAHKFLTVLYANYVIQDYQHLAFYDKGTRDYKKVEEAQKRVHKRYGIRRNQSKSFAAVLTCVAPFCWFVWKGSLTSSRRNENFKGRRS